MSDKKTVAIIGLGYVGLPLALLTDKKGHNVIGIDIDEEKLEKLKRKQNPLKDKKISDELKNNKIDFTTKFEKIKISSIVIICVPTPTYENNLPNLEIIKSASKKVAENLQKNHLIVLESTVNPGISEEVVIPILEEKSNLIAGKDFHFAHCPERVDPGDKKWNVENIPRVIGGTNKRDAEIATDFYKSILSAEIKQMNSIKEAEAVKIVENSFRDINIAFVNELAISFSHLGIDVLNVINGAATKPFAFMPHYPGCGVGGHCIPVDPYYLIDYAKKNGFNHKLLLLARQVNKSMPEFTVNQTFKALEEKSINPSKAKIAVLGLAYKQNLNDYRESPAFEIIKNLQKQGIEPITYDPHLLLKSNTKNLEQALSKADAIIITTAHDEFKQISPTQLKEKNVKVVIDGRNCLEKQDFLDSGIVYKGIGR
jgi:UDP-N-acetyl-D-glucosamine dehydrogenase